MLKRIFAAMLLALVVLSIMPAVTPVVPILGHPDEAQAFFTGYEYWQYVWMYFLQETIPGWDWKDWC